MPRPRRSQRKRPATDTGNGDPLAARRRGMLVVALVLLAIGAAAAVETRRLLSDPDVFFLSNDAGAEWIRADVPFAMKLQQYADRSTFFEHSFVTTQPVHGARLTVRAFRSFIVSLDGNQIGRGAENFDDWKNPYDLPLPDPLPPGTHRLVIGVLNRGAHPCLLAYSRQLDLRTGPGWVIQIPGGRTAPAILATTPIWHPTALQYPSVREALVSLAPWLALIFAVAFAWTIWSSGVSAGQAGWPRRLITAGRVRWMLCAAWLVLAANNIWRIPPEIGFDAADHLAYVKFIAEHRSLPLASDGWQMFQPPLFYLAALPWYAALSSHFGDDVLIKVLRFIPLLCGLAQIEVVYRAARTTFPEKEDLQIIATTVGGLLPMQIYISQSIGNEPLAGLLTSLLILCCVKLLANPGENRRTRFFVLMGFLWGLALLAKLTPLLLAPLLLGVIFVHCRRSGSTLRVGSLRTCLVFGACLLTSGWFYVRNWIELGQPFVRGSFDPATGNLWWQDPSYRTWAQLTTFGESLRHPIYRGVWSLWDAFYSSLWLDGFVSGWTEAPGKIPWNVAWLTAGAALALVPTGLLFAGAATPLRNGPRNVRDVLLFCLAALAIYLAAVIDLFVRLPIYSTAKATYTLGLLPCYALLAAAGAAPLLQFRLLRAGILAALACWAIAACAAYFSITH